MIKHGLQIILRDKRGYPVEGAKITATPEALGEAAQADYDSKRHFYFFDCLRPGFYTICVEQPDYASQKRRVQVHPRPTEITFIMYPVETPYTFRGQVQVPYEPQEHTLGIARAPTDDPDADQKLNQLFTQLELEKIEFTDAVDPSDLPRITQFSSRVIIVRRANLNSDINLILKALNESHLIEAAGPVFHLSKEAVSFYTSLLTIRFRLEVSNSERNDILERERLTLVREMSVAPNLILADAGGRTGDDLNAIARRLMATGRVIYAEVTLFEEVKPDTITPDDLLWPGCWDRQLVCVQDAWQQLREQVNADTQFGLADLIIAVIDNGIKSVDGCVENPDFQGSVTNKCNKIYKLFDFYRGVPNNDRPINDHGVACASIASAMVNNSEGGLGSDFGVVGAAPNTRLMGLIYTSSESENLEMYVWAAGLKARSILPRFPAPIKPGVDILTCSMPFGKDAPLSGAAQDMLDHITNRGRNGKGCIAIFSAGNSSRDIEYDRPYGSYERSFSCAASTLDEKNKEIRACYSGWGKVAWCAPSSTREESISHNPPSSYGVWAADFKEGGNIPSFSEAETKLKEPACKGDKSIFVEDAKNLIVGRRIFVGKPGYPKNEAVPINAIISHTNEVQLASELVNHHYEGEDVIMGPNHHKNRFGGTSAATPLSAGICALVLSANPKLTWVEARQILRDTAVKIDLNNTHPIAQWLDEDDEPIRCSKKPPVFSKGFGFGRLDAGRAVSAALCYKFTRDLMIRKSLNDTGASACALSIDSPDIWVRNMDPAIDPQALPDGYCHPGPHQNPSRSNKRWVYARIKNRGVEDSLDAWVRFYVASSGGTSFVYPEDWEPINGHGNETTHIWNRGTYLIGEVALPNIRPSADFIVNLPWPDELVPPPFTPTGEPWNPYLLVEIVPHDGPLNGIYSHQNNNLAEKAILIID